MNIDGAPLLGTPKQNSFIIKLGGALGFATLLEAVNVGLGLPAATAWRNPFTMADASKVITELLAKCQAAGISTFSARGGRKKKAPKRKAPAPPDPQPPLPVEGRTVQEALAALADDAKMLFRRGCTDAEIRAACGLTAAQPKHFTTEELAAELVNRHALLPLDRYTPLALCDELERRGLPASTLLQTPDRLTQVDNALELLLDLHMDDTLGAHAYFGTAFKGRIRTVLLEAGEIPE